MSDEQEKPHEGKHRKEEEPAWPRDPGKDLDDWLAESNRKAEGSE